MTNFLDAFESYFRPADDRFFCIADHYIGDRYAKEWRVRRILAQVQVRHLNLLGIYLKNVRDEYAHHGAARKPNIGEMDLILDGRARGINGDEYSSRARHLGSNDIIMAIVQRDEIALSQSRLSQRSQSDMISGEADRNSSEREGKLLNVEGEVRMGIQCWRLRVLTVGSSGISVLRVWANSVMP